MVRSLREFIDRVSNPTICYEAGHDRALCQYVIDGLEVPEPEGPLLSSNDASMELPQIMSAGFVHIATLLISRLPPESLSEREISLFFSGLELPMAKSFRAARRPSITGIRFLPPLLVGHRRFLVLSTLSKATTRCAASLLATYPVVSDPHDTNAESSQHLLLRAIEAVLARAYAEGIRIVLTHYIDSLFRFKRDRPHLSEPWVLSRAEAGYLQEVRIVWALSNRSVR